MQAVSCTTRSPDSVLYANPASRIINASRYSLEGLRHALVHEQAFRYEAFTFLVICIALVVLNMPLVWCVMIAGEWLLVMCFELVNSALEKAFDLITKEYSPVIKAGKDMLSAAVFIAICLNIILWVVAVTCYTIP